MMSRTINSARRRTVALGFGAWLLVGCGAGPRPAPAAACDQVCQDGAALRGVRSLMKLAYNGLVMGQKVGAQDAQTDCPPLHGAPGTVHVFGEATANALQGDSFVSLSYDFENCSYAAPPDPTADRNYDITMTGVVTERGTIAVQPSSTTALLIESDSLSLSGTVYDPPLDYAIVACTLAVNQNGTGVAGTLCARNAGFTF